MGDADEKIVQVCRSVLVRKRLRIAFEHDLPCDRNSTRSHTASTSTILWLVHKTPH